MISRISGRWRSTSRARRSSSSSSRRATSAPRCARLPLPPRLYRTLALPPASPAPQNCLREIRSSLEKDKPLVLVQEADPDKGGGTLQALRDECPEDLQPAIFDNDWPLTIWYRIDEFQLISLKIIAEAPPDTTSSVLSLYLPANPT